MQPEHVPAGVAQLDDEIEAEVVGGGCEGEWGVVLPLSNGWPFAGGAASGARLIESFSLANLMSSW